MLGSLASSLGSTTNEVKREARRRGGGGRGHGEVYNIPFELLFMPKAYDFVIIPSPGFSRLLTKDPLLGRIGPGGGGGAIYVYDISMTGKVGQFCKLPSIHSAKLILKEQANMCSQK